MVQVDFLKDLVSAVYENGEYAFHVNPFDELCNVDKKLQLIHGKLFRKSL